MNIWALAKKYIRVGHKFMGGEFALKSEGKYKKTNPKLLKP